MAARMSVWGNAACSDQKQLLCDGFDSRTCERLVKHCLQII